MAKTEVILILVFGFLAVMATFILYGDNGWADLKAMKRMKQQLVTKNDRLMEKNLALGEAIRRLENDPVFIAHTARGELGMVGRDDIIFQFLPPENAGPADGSTGKPAGRPDADPDAGTGTR